MGWKVENGPPKEIYIKSLEPVNVTLFGQRVFADITKDFEMRLLYIVNVIASILIREQERVIRHRRRGNCMTREAEDGGMWSQAKGCSEPSKGARAKEQILP